MPTLHWIGKDKVINHHRDVPFRLLDHKYGTLANGTQTTEPSGSGNQIIHGDNLEALKALLPQYEGRVKCIYIDPPYNTGNEGWVYNDNVNDPKIKKWLSQVVGKEGEDLSRHDKWLCMMYPRLKLLHKLLAEDGAIFISIDDNEQASLKLVLDEIYGPGNFVANIIWQKRTSPDARKNLGPAHDYIVAYAKKKALFKMNLVELSGERAKAYKNPDNDPRGPWASVDMSGQTGHATENQFYAIPAPTGKFFKPTKGRCWAMAEDTFLGLIADKRVWFGAKGTARPRQKKFLSETEGVTVWTWWPNNEVSHNQEASKELTSIFGEAGEFDTPKPTKLLRRILQIATDKDSIILDSFAGSGTTAHAVLKLNQQDGGNRKFILTEMEDYAEHITAERVKRVMQGYGGQPGTGGSFDYLTLGEPVFTDGGELNEQAGLLGLRQYIYYAETKQALPSSAPAGADNAAFLALHDDTAYYFHYKPDAVTTLSYDFLATMRTRAGQYIIYADNCLLPAEFLTQHSIIFKKIPRDISRF